MDCVLIYAQPGNGRRASLFTDYTFGVWDKGKLVPFAKAYSGLSDEEIREVDAFVRRNTLEKFGPVHSVKPELVFELAFEGIQRSPRHRSGIAVRFPRMARWRHDKKAEDADTHRDDSRTDRAKSRAVTRPYRELRNQSPRHSSTRGKRNSGDAHGILLLNAQGSDRRRRTRRTLRGRGAWAAPASKSTFSNRDPSWAAAPRPIPCPRRGRDRRDHR